MKSLSMTFTLLIHLNPNFSIDYQEQAILDNSIDNNQSGRGDGRWKQFIHFINLDWTTKCGSDAEAGSLATSVAVYRQEGGFTDLLQSGKGCFFVPEIHLFTSTLAPRQKKSIS
jgi:hypothetical protein